MISDNFKSEIFELTQLTKNLTCYGIRFHLFYQFFGFTVCNNYRCTFSRFFSSKFRWFVTGILSKLTYSDIEYVYDNKDDAFKDVSKELEKSTKVYILASRGNRLKRDPFKKLINSKPSKRNLDLKIILPDYQNTQPFDFIYQRENEIKKFDVAYGNGRLKEEIHSNIDHLRHIYNNDSNCGIVLSLANNPHFCNILLTDDHLYFQPYNKHRHGEEDPVMKFRRGHTYRAFSRYFDLIWQSVPNEIG